MADCVNITPTEVRVSLTDYIKHDGYVHHLHELYRTLHQLSDEFKTKTLRFISVETEPFRMIAFDRVLEHVATSLDIPQDRLILETLDHHPRFTSQWATLVTQPTTSIDRMEGKIELDKCIRNPDAALFGGFFGRFTIHRFLMAYFLETEIRNHSVVTFHPPRDWVDYEIESVKKYYSKELEWYYNRKSEKNDLVGYNGRIGDFASLWDYHTIYSSHHIEAVIETNVYDCGWWTEKTLKCLYTGKPFLLFGVQGQLAELKRLGFRTFSPWIDESYDLESNTDKRFDMIRDEIRRIAALPNNNYRQRMIQEINKIADYNKENYDRLIEEYQDNYDPSH